MKFYIATILLVSLSTSVMSATDLGKKALKFVPDGAVQGVDRDEVMIKTKAGGLIEVELTKDGDLEEASGNMVETDTFAPGNGLLPLNEAVASMKKQGKNVSGEWSLDKDFLRDWEYEFEGAENGKQYEYSMNAKTGKLVKSEAD